MNRETKDILLGLVVREPGIAPRIIRGINQKEEIVLASFDKDLADRLEPLGALADFHEYKDGLSWKPIKDIIPQQVPYANITDQKVQQFALVTGTLLGMLETEEVQEYFFKHGFCLDPLKDKLKNAAQIFYK